MKPLEGRSALVTGGTRGIGAAITRKLVGWGAHVHAIFVDHEQPAKALQAELGARWLTLHRVDVSDPTDVARIEHEVIDLDFVIHAAAAAPYRSLLDASPAQWDFTMNTNARSLLTLAQAVAPTLERSDQARLITITNSAPKKIIPGAGLLAAAKAAMETLTVYLAAELAPMGIVVNAVRPGMVATDVLKVRPDYADQLARESRLSPWPGGPVTTAEVVADAVAMLCLAESRWISGEIVSVDGGFRLWGMWDEEGE